MFVHIDGDRQLGQFLQMGQVAGLAVLRVEVLNVVDLEPAVKQVDRVVAVKLVDTPNLPGIIKLEGHRAVTRKANDCHIGLRQLPWIKHMPETAGIGWDKGGLLGRLPVRLSGGRLAAAHDAGLLKLECGH